MKVTPVLLIILDGFGCRAEPRRQRDRLRQQTQFGPALWKNYPHTPIHASEAAVGLPAGRWATPRWATSTSAPGGWSTRNSPASTAPSQCGHFFTNPALLNAVHRRSDNGKALHIFGLLSDGGVHSHENHIHAMLEMAARDGLNKVYLHAFLDGRDTPPKSAEDLSAAGCRTRCDRLGVGRIASIIGRYYAMDRDKPLAAGKGRLRPAHPGRRPNSGGEPRWPGLETAYARGETDEFVKPTAIVPPGASRCAWRTAMRSSS